MGNLCHRKLPLTDEEIAERQLNKEIDRENRKDEIEDNQIHKLLFLGAGESGKSTLFKQMIHLYGTGLQCETWGTIIETNVLTSITTLLDQSDLLYLPECRVSSENQHLKERFQDTKITELTPEIGEVIEKLFLDDGIQNTLCHTSKFHLSDSASYFLKKVKEIADADYVPTTQDVLRARVRTCGIVEEDFLIDDNHFKMYDVGGQRSERSKWVHCFEHVTALLFVASLSGYDQFLYEDETQNRLTEALDLFETTANMRWFKNMPIILFLNKADLFQEKIKKVPFEGYFPEFSGDPTDFDQTSTYIKDLFLMRYRGDKTIYCHVTTATNTENMQTVFNAVQDIVIEQALMQANLL